MFLNYGMRMLWLIALSVAAPHSGGASEQPPAIRIDSIGARYTLDDYEFEINPNTGSAAIRLEYVYRPGRTEGDETLRDLGPRTKTVPGLVYDRATRSVVFETNAKRTTCAVEAGQRFLLWKRHRLKGTGECVVASHINHHVQTRDWRNSSFDTLDAYFEVRRH